MIKLCDFTMLNNDDSQLVLSWRNSFSVRRYMNNPNLIDLKNHEEFIEKLKTDKHNKYFLVKSNQQNIGVVYLNNILDISAELGIYSNPDIKGVGEILMKSIVDYAFDELSLKKIILEVFVDNNKAIKLYKKNNFVEVGLYEFENKKLLKMELENENR